MTKVFNSRRRLIMAVSILLAGGVVFEKWHRAGTVTARYPPTDLANAPTNSSTEFVMTNKNFEANIDLWLNPGVRTHVVNISYANFVFQSELHISPLDFDRLATRGDDGRSYALPFAMVDKDIIYSLFSLGSFKATFNLTPTKARPEDLFPTQLKPGLGGSFDF
jgi:hypothetical protein